MEEMRDNDNDIEFIEPDERYNYGKGEPFSHSQIVMATEKKCVDAGCEEMRTGYWNEKRDKFGNNILTYVPDTRKKFIECVETLRMVMAPDVDEEIAEELKNIEEELKSLFNSYYALEEKEWKTAPPNVILKWKMEGIVLIRDRLNPKFSYLNEYLTDKVSIYRKMFSILDKQAKKLGYYKEGILEA